MNKHTEKHAKTQVSSLKIPEKCHLKKGELAKIKQHIADKNLSPEEAQAYLNKENADCEMVYVKAIRAGYYETQRYREGQKFHAKRKYLPCKWMQILETKVEEVEDEDEPVQPSFDGRSNRQVI